MAWVGAHCLSDVGASLGDPPQGFEALMNHQVLREIGQARHPQSEAGAAWVGALPVPDRGGGHTAADAPNFFLARATYGADALLHRYGGEYGGDNLKQGDKVIASIELGSTDGCCAAPTVLRAHCTLGTFERTKAAR
jgi:hypothetical protein